MKILDQLLQIFLSGLKTPALIMLFGLGPLVVTGWFLFRKKEQSKAQASDPFTELPLRPPGESLRIKIEELSEIFGDRLAELAASSMGAAIITIVAPDPQRTLVAAACGIVATLSYVRNVPKLFKTARLLWDYRLGFTGERVVGEELNQLLARGFHVFHDVPFDHFNIDHVIVGAPGVYAVETKTRRKPANIKGTGRATVIFDGTALQFPTGSNSKALDQARLNAATLAKWLTKATGEQVTASAIVTLPGWFVDRRAKSDVNVLNPSEIKRSFPNQPQRPVSPEQIKRITHQLTERCRLQPEKTK